jgi:hypothetical protein
MVNISLNITNQHVSVGERQRVLCVLMCSMYSSSNILNVMCMQTFCLNRGEQVLCTAESPLFADSKHSTAYIGHPCSHCGVKWNIGIYPLKGMPMCVLLASVFCVVILNFWTLYEGWMDTDQIGEVLTVCFNRCLNIGVRFLHILKCMHPPTTFHYYIVEFLRDDETHVDLEVCYVLGGRVFNKPSS